MLPQKWHTTGSYGCFHPFRGRSQPQTPATISIMAAMATRRARSAALLLAAALAALREAFVVAPGRWHRDRVCQWIGREISQPKCSMYGIFTYIWVIFRADVGKYSSTMEHLGRKTTIFNGKISDFAVDVPLNRLKPIHFLGVEPPSQRLFGALRFDKISIFFIFFLDDLNIFEWDDGNTSMDEVV